MDPHPKGSHLEPEFEMGSGGRPFSDGPVNDISSCTKSIKDVKIDISSECLILIKNTSEGK